MGSLANHLHVRRIAPETRNRNPELINGGIVSTTKKIARYVDPQMIYIDKSASQVLVFISASIKINYF